MPATPQLPYSPDLAIPISPRNKPQGNVTIRQTYLTSCFTSVVQHYKWFSTLQAVFNITSSFQHYKRFSTLQAALSVLSSERNSEQNSVTDRAKFGQA
jgi:hypothetical protein